MARTKKLREFDAKESARIPGLTNRELLDETLDLAGGDDYDGCMTDEGHITYNILRAELEDRLKDWLA